MLHSDSIMQYTATPQAECQKLSVCKPSPVLQHGRSDRLADALLDPPPATTMQTLESSEGPLVRKRFRSGVNIARTRSFPGADIGSDHDLLMMTFRLRLKKIGGVTNQPR